MCANHKRYQPINLLLIISIITFISLITFVRHCDSHWVAENVQEIERRLVNAGITQESSLPRVKNVILFVGDGMGITTLTATRLYKGQKNGRSGENEKLTWDEFLALAHIKTFTANTQIGESAACATAMFTGIKSNAEVIGFDAKTGLGQCNNTRSNSRLTTIFDWAQKAGMKTGFVTTTRVTHATPGALYAHVGNRYWEDDSKIPVVQRRQCKDISRQLIESLPGRNINVIMGGGRRSFLPVTTANLTSRKFGRRLDGRNLIFEWTRDKQKNSRPAEFVTTRSEMQKINDDTEFVLGLFANSHLSFHADRHQNAETREQPTLAEMTATAIKVLSRQNDKGFILVVESGKIDHAHHHNNAYRALDETLALDEAVKTALESSYIDLKESLIIVTADHGEGMVFSGYSTPLGSDILGMDRQVSDVDQRHYPVLTYAAGPGQYAYERNIHPKDTVQPSTVPKSWGNHGGEDVLLAATGALSTLLFSGTIDQTYIPQAIAYALCISIHTERCTLTLNDLNQFGKLSLAEENEISYDNSNKLSDTHTINLIDEWFNHSTNAQPLSDNSCKLLSNNLAFVIISQILLFYFLL